MDVVKAAEGKWLHIFTAIAPKLNGAIAAKGRHCPDPIHGGTDGFRLYKDVVETGGGYSNKSGKFPNGIELIKWVNGWDFVTTLEAIGDFLGVKPQVNQVTASNAEEGEVIESPNPKRSVGRIHRVGFAPFRFDEKNKKSFFVEIEVNQRGHLFTLWGADLKRALEESGAQIGDHAAFIQKGKRAVTVTSKGAEIETYRNYWEVKASNPNRTNAKPTAQKEKVLNEPEWLQEAQASFGQEAAEAVSITSQDVPSWLLDAEKAFGKISEEDPKAVEKLHKLWESSKPLGEDKETTMVVLKYLHSRGIFPKQAIHDDLRTVASLPYYEKNEEGQNVKVGDFPAMLCAIRDQEGKMVSIHRSFLDPSGAKAPVSMPRKMMAGAARGSISGGAIRLGGLPEDGILSICEGIENALSVYQGIGKSMPVWACGTAVLLEKLELPKGIKAVAIWGDLDRNERGWEAATTLKRRLDEAGIISTILMPKGPIPESAKGVDWNDVLKHFGMEAFASEKKHLKIAMQQMIQKRGL